MTVPHLLGRWGGVFASVDKHGHPYLLLTQIDRVAPYALQRGRFLRITWGAWRAYQLTLRHRVAALGRLWVEWDL